MFVKYTISFKVDAKEKRIERWLIWSYLCSCKFVLHAVSKAPNDNIIVKFQETWMPKRKPKKKDWSTVCPLFWGNFRPRSKSKQKCYGTVW